MKGMEKKMPKFFVTTNQIQEDTIVIQNEDVNHIKNVLRAKIGDTIEICDSNTSKNYHCKIEQIQEKNIDCHIIEEMASNVESPIQVSIFQGLPKADKMEWIIQKAVELGVYDITPLEMKRCVVKLNEKDKVKKIQRWQKISEGAAKQSGRDRIPTIHPVINIKTLCEQIKEYDLVLVAYENEKTHTLKQELKNIKLDNKEMKIAIVIGPEGGIDPEEMMKFKEHDTKIITLGNRILRTETVALHMLSIIMYELDS